jgi:glycosyltransferase involved in cell wall biosynthesis
MSQQPDVRLKAFTRGNNPRAEIFTEHQVEAGYFRFGGAISFWDHWRYRSSLKSFHPDVVLTFMNRATKLTPPGDYKLVSRLGHYYDLKYYRHCDYWVGITPGICDHLIQGGMPAERVVHIPNFVDENRAEPIARNSFDTPSDQPIILAFGRLHVNKGFDVLLRALALMDNGVLWLAGSGPEEMALKQLATELGVSKRVRFLGWRNDVNALLATADVFVCPSRHEGLGSILLEAWYHGCPVVAANSQGPRDIISSEVDGLLVPIDDSKALAGAVGRLLANENEGELLKNAGYSQYQKSYSKTIIIEQYKEFLSNI